MDTGKQTIQTGRIYANLRIIQNETREDDHALIEKYVINDSTTKKTFAKMETLYPPVSGDIDHTFLKESLDFIDVGAIDPDWWMFSVVFVILSYLLFEGVTWMIYLGAYHIFTKENSSSSGLRLSGSDLS